MESDALHRCVGHNAGLGSVILRTAPQRWVGTQRGSRSHRGARMAKPARSGLSAWIRFIIARSLLSWVNVKTHGREPSSLHHSLEGRAFHAVIYSPWVCFFMAIIWIMQNALVIGGAHNTDQPSSLNRHLRERSQGETIPASERLPFHRHTWCFPLPLLSLARIRPPVAVGSFVVTALELPPLLRRRVICRLKPITFAHPERPPLRQITTSQVRPVSLFEFLCKNQLLPMQDHYLFQSRFSQQHPQCPLSFARSEGHEEQVLLRSVEKCKATWGAALLC